MCSTPWSISACITISAPVISRAAVAAGVWVWAAGAVMVRLVGWKKSNKKAPEGGWMRATGDNVTGQVTPLSAAW
jgi:hypothetical protein